MPKPSEYLGHRTYLAGKPKGESSMSETAGYGETVRPYARQDPDGKVKATLLQPKYPIWNGTGQEGRLKPDAALKSLSHHERSTFGRAMHP